MGDATLEKRVDRLELALMELAYQSRKTEMALEQLSKEMRDFKEEMRAFKEEMKAFKDDTQAFKDEMRAFKDEMRAFKDEMRAFKDEMRAFKDEMEKGFKEMNKRWGELANKMGTLVEDIVAPGVPAAIKKTFGWELEELSTRRRKRKNGREREYDVIAVTPNHIFVIDVKSTYKPHYLEDFQMALEEFLDFFPDYSGKKLVGVVASLNMSQDIVDLATKRGWLALNLSGDYLEFLNARDIEL